MWTELSSDNAIAIRKDYLYAGIASIKNSHSRLDIANTALAHGLTFYDFATQDERPALGRDPDDGYYRIAFIVVASRDAGTIPWKAPFPFSLADGSRLVRVWAQPLSAVNSAKIAPPEEVNPATGGSWVLSLGVLSLIGIGSWLLIRRFAR